MSAGSSERRARMALSCVIEGGDLPATEMVAAVGAEVTWDAVLEGTFGDGPRLRALRLDLALVEARARQCAARFVVDGDDEWPDGLMDLSRCSPIQHRGGVPIGLWLRGPGRLAELMESSVAIVGSRASSSYGAGVAADLATELAERGVTIVSGGAFGIDAAAHRGALAARGKTVAVLACGVDVPYPRGNAALFDWLARDQLLVSELAPGATPTRVRFLARNRMIAAMARGTVVVEAAIRSGARNTAHWAQECGRQLMAVPGPVHSAMSVGPHLMIRDQQAVLVTDAGEVLEVISPVGEHTAGSRQGALRVTDGMDPERLSVFEAVSTRRYLPAGEIALGSGVALPRCLAELAALEGAGLVHSDERGWRLA